MKPHVPIHGDLLPSILVYGFRRAPFFRLENVFEFPAAGHGEPVPKQLNRLRLYCGQETDKDCNCRRRMISEIAAEIG